MKNTFAISSLSRQLGRVCDQIDHLAYDAQEISGKPNDLCEFYEGLLLDEVEHAQVLMLRMTDLVSQAIEEETANTDEGDGSAFAQGDLDAKKTGDAAGEEGGEDDT